VASGKQRGPVTLFGYDEFILREISHETRLASVPVRRQ
jgi:hypothetical protein